MSGYRLGVYFYSEGSSPVRELHHDYPFEAASDAEAIEFAKETYDEQITIADYTAVFGPGDRFVWENDHLRWP